MPVFIGSGAVLNFEVGSVATCLEQLKAVGFPAKKILNIYAGKGNNILSRVLSGGVLF